MRMYFIYVQSCIRVDKQYSFAKLDWIQPSNHNHAVLWSCHTCHPALCSRCSKLLHKPSQPIQANADLFLKIYWRMLSGMVCCVEHSAVFVVVPWTEPNLSQLDSKAPGSFRAHNSPSTAPPCDPHSEHGWIQTQGTTELHPDPSHPWHMGLLGTGRLSGSSDLAQHRPPGCRWWQRARSAVFCGARSHSSSPGTGRNQETPHGADTQTKSQRNLGTACMNPGLSSQEPFTASHDFSKKHCSAPQAHSSQVKLKDTQVTHQGVTWRNRNCKHTGGGGSPGFLLLASHALFTPHTHCGPFNCSLRRQPAHTG